MNSYHGTCRSNKGIQSVLFQLPRQTKFIKLNQFFTANINIEGLFQEKQKDGLENSTHYN